MDPDNTTQLAEEANHLLAESNHGVLATLDPREGFPYASLVDILPLDDGDVVFFLSNLAVHTTNLTIDERASVFVDSGESQEILAHPRLTIMGRIRKVEDRELHKEAYLARHPNAANYIGFSDFAFYRLHRERARYIAGFGKMGWIENE